MRIAQMKKRGGGKTETQKAKRQRQVVEAQQRYISVAQPYLEKARISLNDLPSKGLLSPVPGLTALEIQQFMAHAERQIEQIKRRVIKGETIPHHEEVFSLFEPHTEWIVKGKAGVPVALGLRVCVREDQYQFLLHHKIMEKQTDDQVAIAMLSETQTRFPDLAMCSFDKGFHSPDNQKRLSEMLAGVGLPRTGKRSKKVEALESSDAFQHAREKHSAVESAVNALAVPGLERCPEHGLKGFKRYVALSIVAPATGNDLVHS